IGGGADCQDDGADPDSYHSGCLRAARGVLRVAGGRVHDRDLVGVGAIGGVHGLGGGGGGREPGEGADRRGRRGVGWDAGVGGRVQVAWLIRKTLRDGGSAGYRVWVASSIAPTLAPGSGIGICATGAHPARSAAWQVDALITSICGWLKLPA